MSRESRRLAGSGDPLVLVHGLGHSRHAWFPVLEALERRHLVLSLDLPGFGEAPPLAAGVVPAVPALADAVEREMDVAGFGTAHVAGNSMGGWIALELARRGRARSVVAISPAGGGNRRERSYARRLMKGIRLGARAATPLAGAIAAPGPTRPLFFGVFFARPNRLPREEAAYALRAYAHGPAFSAACNWLFSRRADGLEEVQCPVTIAWGTRDLVLLPRQAGYFLARLRDARFAALDRLGHIPMYDDAERVTAVILEATRAAPPEAAVSPSEPSLRPARG